jgi:hypothetical protein
MPKEPSAHFKLWQIRDIVLEKARSSFLERWDTTSIRLSIFWAALSPLHATHFHETQYISYP